MNVSIPYLHVDNIYAHTMYMYMQLLMTLLQIETCVGRKYSYRMAENIKILYFQGPEKDATSFQCLALVLRFLSPDN